MPDLPAAGLTEPSDDHARPTDVHRVLAAKVDPQSCLVVGGLVAVLGGLTTAASTGLWLVNLDGPFGERRAPGTWSSLGLGLATAAVLFGLTWWVGRRSAVAVVLLVCALLPLAVVLVPTRIDVSESFLPRPNERKSCSGLTFEHYPLGVMDASSVTYCVGLEHPRSPG